MRATLSLIALIAATPALADEVFTQAPVTSAEIYPEGATLTLTATVDLPAGTHTVFLPYPDADSVAALPRVQASEGVAIGTLGFRDVALPDPRAMYTPAQTEAAEAVDLIEAAIRAKSDEIAAAQAEVNALKAKIDYLAKIKPPEGADAEAIIATATLVAEQTQTAQTALVAAKAAVRPLKDDRADLVDARKAAEADLARLSPPTGSEPMLAVEVSTATAGPVSLGLTQQTWDAGWSPDYALDFDRDSGALTFDRKLQVYQDTGHVWNGAQVTLATARPSDQIAPREVWPDKADIFDPDEMRPLSRAANADMEAAPMVEPMIMAEEAPMRTAAFQVDGLDVSYIYPEPVTLVPGDVTELALDTLTLEGEGIVQAAPRYDETAFLMARFTNTLDEPILPGSARLSRNGNYVGQTELELIPAGADEMLAFGPIDGIRIDTIIKRNAEGDAGFITKSSNRRQEITLEIENLTGEEQMVRTLYPLPFSEKDDLEITVVATPAPDETDVDDKRGVSAWDLTLTPGETQSIDVVVDFDWPEGMRLSWQP